MLGLYVYLLLTGSRAIGIFGVVVFGLGLFSGVWALLDRRPQLVADAYGVADRRGRRLAWPDIETISIEQLRPEVLFALDRKGMRVMIFRARPGVNVASRWPYLSLGRSKNCILVLERAVLGTLEGLSKDIQLLSGRDVVVRPGTARRDLRRS
jgi:hypothetical protein